MMSEIKYLSTGDYTLEMYHVDFKLSNGSIDHTAYHAIIKNKSGAVVLNVECRSAIERMAILKDFCEVDYRGMLNEKC